MGHVKRKSAKCADSYHHAHAQGLIRVFLCTDTVYSMHSRGPNQTVWSAQVDLGFRFPHISEDTFSHCAGNISTSCFILMPSILL